MIFLFCFLEVFLFGFVLFFLFTFSQLLSNYLAFHLLTKCVPDKSWSSHASCVLKYLLPIYWWLCILSVYPWSCFYSFWLFRSPSFGLFLLFYRLVVIEASDSSVFVGWRRVWCRIRVVLINVKYITEYCKFRLNTCCIKTLHKLYVSYVNLMIVIIPPISTWNVFSSQLYTMDVIYGGIASRNTLTLPYSS